MHVSLDSALGRQRRLNSVGESVLQIAPSAAAAYSLRSLTGGDPKVVRVRRASDNHEQDFTASEVSSGALTSFVNAQVIAPLDIQALTATGRDGDFLIAKAAYSLRSLGTRQATLAATGDTVARANGKFVCQVRRSTDDALKSFTADEVTDGTLLSFVTEAVSTLLNSAYYFSPDSHSHVDFDSDITLADGETMSLQYFFDGVTGTDLLFDSGGASTNSMLITTSISPRVRINGENVDFGVGCKLVLNTLDTLTIARSGNDITITTATGAVTKSFTSGAFTFNRLGGNSSQTFQGVFTNLQIGSRHNYTGLGGAATAWNDTVGSNNGTPDNLVLFTGQTVDGFVSKWYDQSVTTQAGDTATGNHAVQGTAANQPKIVNAGSLVTGGLDFDGTAHQLTLSSTLGITSAASHFAVTNLNSTGSIDTFFDNRDSSTDGYSIRTNDASNINFDWLTSDAEVARVSGEGLYYFNKTSSQTQSGANGGTLVTASESGSVSVTTVPRIGARSFTSALNFFEGTINELIIYNSDQTDNRTAIEANIGEAYSIDLPSGVDPGFDQVDGFVETWYDQSGNVPANDALQPTAAEQPKIVDGGNLNADGIDFDGSNYELNIPTDLISNVNSVSAFLVSKSDVTDSGTPLALSDNSPNDARWYLANIASNNFNLGYQDSNEKIVIASADTSERLFSATSGTVTTEAFINGTSGGTTSSISSFSPLNSGGIGSVNGFGRFNGHIREVIIYDTDQTANRPALEANIMTNYGIS